MLNLAQLLARVAPPTPVPTRTVRRMFSDAADEKAEPADKKAEPADDIVAEVIRCRDCERDLPREAFYPRRLPSGLVTLYPYCKRCHNKRSDERKRCHSKRNDDSKRRRMREACK